MSEAILNMAAPTTPPARLTMARTIRLVFFSSLVWLCAALFIHFAGPRGVFEGWRGIATYLVTIPATIPLNRRALKIAGLPLPFMPAVIAVTTATATLEDGTAMRLLPQLYGGNPAIIQAGAIWLLWAIGIATALAVIVPAMRQKP
jgi:hypothetical protein